MVSRGHRSCGAEALIPCSTWDRTLRLVGLRRTTLPEGVPEKSAMFSCQNKSSLFWYHHVLCKSHRLLKTISFPQNCSRNSFESVLLRITHNASPSQTHNTWHDGENRRQKYGWAFTLKSRLVFSHCLFWRVNQPWSRVTMFFLSKCVCLCVCVNMSVVNNIPGPALVCSSHQNN